VSFALRLLALKLLVGSLVSYIVSACAQDKPCGHCGRCGVPFHRVVK